MLRKEISRLKELNREITEVLKQVCKINCLYKDEGAPNLCGNCIIGFALKGDTKTLQEIRERRIRDALN